jgi:hypothetical protein
MPAEGVGLCLQIEQLRLGFLRAGGELPLLSPDALRFLALGLRLPAHRVHVGQLRRQQLPERCSLSRKRRPFAFVGRGAAFSASRRRICEFSERDSRLNVWASRLRAVLRSATSARKAACSARS